MNQKKRKRKKDARPRYLTPEIFLRNELDLVRDCTRWLDEQQILYVKNYKFEPAIVKKHGRTWRKTGEQGTPDLIVFLPNKIFAIKAAENGHMSKYFEAWCKRAQSMNIKSTLIKSIDDFKNFVTL